MFIVAVTFVLCAILARLILWALGSDWEMRHGALGRAIRVLSRWAAVVPFAWFALLVLFVLNHLAYGPVT